MVFCGNTVVCNVSCCHPMLSPIVANGAAYVSPPLPSFSYSPSLSPISLSPPPFLSPVSSTFATKTRIQSKLIYINSGPPNCFYFIPNRKQQSYGMEQIWNEQFHTLFETFPHPWRLIPIERKPFGGNILYNYNDSAKVRFCCDTCGHGWTSMKGRVAFFFDVTIPGIVTYTLYGQQCIKCESQSYEDAMWYPEEVSKVLSNVRNEIGHIFYGLYFKPKEKMRRAGKPRTPHNSDLCQACKDGICNDK